MINIGIIGTHHGKLHAELLSQLTNVNIKYICGATNKKTQRIAKELTIPRFTTNYKEVLADNGIDLVIIASPNHLHKVMFKDAIVAQKHVLLEKPAGVNSSEIDEMITFARVHNYEKFVIVDHEMRFNPIIQHIKSQLSQEVIGKVKEIHLTKYHGTENGNNTYREWEVLSKTGGGQVQLVGSHFIDLARYILDFPKFIRGEIHKRISHQEKVLTNSKQVTSSAEDVFKGTLIFESNIKVYLHDSILGNGHKTLELKVIGEKGSFLYDDQIGLYLQQNVDIQKVEVVDTLPEVKHQSRSLISGSLKYLHKALIETINTNKYNSDFCTLKQARENSLYLENCKIY